MTIRWLTIALASAALAGCSVGHDVSAANQAVDQFHVAFNSGQTAALYAAAGPELKGSATADAWNTMMATLRAKLGAFKSSSSTGFNENVTAAGARLSLTISSEYERGHVDEEFVYDLVNGRPVLAGWHAKSPVLTGN